MKKFLTVVLAVAIVCTTAACGASSNASSETAVTEEAAPEETENAKVRSASDNTDEENAAAQEADSSASYSVTFAAAWPSVPAELDEAVGAAVIDKNSGTYLEGECKAEGHIVLDYYEEKNMTTVYALTTYGEYGFQNGKFIKISGSGVIPAVIIFSIDKEGDYIFNSYTEPSDGSGYTASVKELFPKELYNSIISVSDSDESLLKKQERKYAKQYLNDIGRSAEIGDYSDINKEIPDISDEAYNAIFDRYWEYPYWIGTQEKIEGGKRYVYETQWKNYGNGDSLIYLTKYIYDTGEIIRTINIHIDDGEIQSSEEKVLRLVES